MERVYEEAFTEVDQILKMMPIDLQSKIPIQFRHVISENKAENYRVNIQEPLREQKLRKETVVILGLIYRDFLASPEEKEQLQLKDAEELKKIELEMQEKYGIENKLKKRRNNKEKHNIEEQDNSTELTVYKKQSVFRQFFNFIRNIFNKNKF